VIIPDDVIADRIKNLPQDKILFAFFALLRDAGVPRDYDAIDYMLAWKKYYGFRMENALVDVCINHTAALFGETCKVTITPLDEYYDGVRLYNIELFRTNSPMYQYLWSESAA
jgi:hypothetical protein